MASVIPFLVKHVAIAIYESGDVHGSSPTQKITGAMDIARHRLVEYGFLRRGSEKGPVADIRLTPKGMQRELKHKYHGPRAKNLEFDRLFSLIEGAQEVEDAPKDVEPENLESARLQRTRRKQTRHAFAAKSAAKPRRKAKVPVRVKKAKSAKARRR